MATSINPAVTLLLSILLIVFTVSTPAIADEEPFAFPATIGEWNMHGEPQEYLGDDLFLYINGGAELYHEYGFDKVSIADYQRGDLSVAVEIYQFDQNAFGIYSMLSGDEPGNVALGNGALFAEYYLMFWSGNALVALTAHSELPNGYEDMKELSIGVADLLDQAQSLPAYVAALPGETVPGSTKYLRGSLALQNVSGVFPPLVGGFSEAVTAMYPWANETYRILMLKYEGDKTATDVFKAIQEFENDQYEIQVVSPLVLRIKTRELFIRITLLDNELELVAAHSADPLSTKTPY